MLVTIEKAGPVAIVTLNRPDAMNALSSALRAELASATRLAHDIAGSDPAMVAAYKQLIDDGYALPFGEGLALEHRRSGVANREVNADDIEARRRAVMERGRGQV